MLTEVEPDSWFHSCDCFMKLVILHEKSCFINTCDFPSILSVLLLLQVKSMMLTDAGSHEPLCPYHS